MSADQIARSDLDGSDSAADVQFIKYLHKTAFAGIECASGLLSISSNKQAVFLINHMPHSRQQCLADCRH